MLYQELVAVVPLADYPTLPTFSAPLPIYRESGRVVLNRFHLVFHQAPIKC